MATIMIMMMSRMVYDDDGDGYGGADDCDDDGEDDAIFAILWNSWSLRCALYNATRRLSVRNGSIPT